MELRHLQYFLVLAEELSFSGAARRLHVAQPSLSQQIRQLERELQTELFDRSRRPVQLTRAGELLLGDAYNLVQEVEATARDVRRAGRGEVGRVRIGYSYGGLYDLVLTLLRRLRDAYPDVNMVIEQLPEREQLPALRTRRVDMVLGRLTEPLTSDIAVQPLRDERLIAILPTHHPLAANQSVMLTDLRDERFVMFPRRLEPVIFDNYIQACLNAGFTLCLEHEVSDAQTQALAIAAGLGVGLSGEHLALRFPELVYRPVEPFFAIAKVAALWTESRVPEALVPFLGDL
ncbi:MAG TPA: LysR substrate-binding domain-containing protein [Acidimicrobiales bacterium]|nr:LysR substrate-binding domain-containing protein [Acidimicrobiales bacterium]